MAKVTVTWGRKTPGAEEYSSLTSEVTIDGAVDGDQEPFSVIEDLFEMAKRAVDDSLADAPKRGPALATPAQVQKLLSLGYRGNTPANELSKAQASTMIDGLMGGDPRGTRQDSGSSKGFDPNTATMPFGKHKGLLWISVPPGYLEWLKKESNKPDIREKAAITFNAMGERAGEHPDTPPDDEVPF